MNTYEARVVIDDLLIENSYRAESEEQAVGMILDDLCRVFPIDGAWIRANAHRMAVDAFIALCDMCGYEVPLVGGCGCLVNESRGIYA